MDVNGAEILKGYLDADAQSAIAAEVAEVVAAAPFVRPMTSWGKPMSVRMTSAGRYGWLSDRSGYRYAGRHPDGMAWPAIPRTVLNVWADLVSARRAPDCCLINHYAASARMGLHQDRDEADFSWPVLSISLGDTGIFRIGGTRRSDPTRSVALESGDVVLLGGAARLAFHGIDKIRGGSSPVSPWGGRVNLTLRVVD